MKYTANTKNTKTFHRKAITGPTPIPQDNSALTPASGLATLTCVPHRARKKDLK